MALTNRTLVILKYLWETTDETHPVSLADISAYLEQYEITADPRTLRKDIEQLIEFGILQPVHHLLIDAHTEQLF